MSEQLGSVENKPLAIVLPGEFDFGAYPLTAAWEEQLPELGVDVRVLDGFSIPGAVKSVRKAWNGIPHYDCYWTPGDYSEHIKATIDALHPEVTYFVAQAGGAEDAERDALRLAGQGYRIGGVVSVAQTEFIGQPRVWAKQRDYYHRCSHMGAVGGPAAGDASELVMRQPHIFNLFNALDATYSCMRFVNPERPRTSEAACVRIPVGMLDAYGRPFQGVAPGFEDFKGSTAELLGLPEYTIPTVFMVGTEDTYTPADSVEALMRRTNKQAPTEFVLLDGVNHDIRSDRRRVQRVVEATIDKLGQLITTNTVARPRPLNALLGFGQAASTAASRQIVVLSTARPVQFSAPIIETATRAGVPTVALVSHNAAPASVVSIMQELGAVGLIAEVPPGFSLRMTEGFVSPKHRSVADRESNLWIKRDIGLLLADEDSKRNVFLSDDDIRLTPADLEWAEAVLTSYKIAGFLPRYFCDKSVVYHADYLAGGDPDLEGVSIAGNSLAVSAAAAAEMYFDRGYNEDRMYISKFSEEGAAAYLGEVQQLPYDPFTDPARAASEVFGDVLADGVFYLQGLGLSFRDVGEDYWRFTILRYKKFIDNIAVRLVAKREGGDLDERIPRALAALHAAKVKLETYTAADFVSYIRDWNDDSERWRERYAKRPRDLTVHERLTHLGLTAHIIGSSRRTRNGLLY